MYDARTILKRRHVALLIVRSASMVLLAFGVYHAIYSVFVAFALGGVDGFLTVWDDAFNRSGMALGGLASGGLLGVLSRRIAKWIVPPSRLVCPNCDYELRDLTAGRCPECGCLLEEGRASRGRE